MMDQNAPFDLILMAGQSNMVGYKTEIEDLAARWQQQRLYNPDDLLSHQSDALFSRGLACRSAW